MGQGPVWEAGTQRPRAALQAQAGEGGRGGRERGVKEGVRKRRGEEEEEERKYGVMVGGKEDEEGEFC